jgi:NAD(P)-dependent dehydrogenase (short-subunit alcohol dehydrogenase family)
MAMRGQLVLVALLICARGAAAQQPAGVDFFEKQIRPILAARCHECHGPEKQESDLRLDSAASNESIIGTGFWFMYEQTHAPTDIRQHEADRVDNQIDVMTKAFLRITVGCARCHDHKFDAISTRDCYALAGFLKSSRQQIALLDWQNFQSYSSIAAKGGQNGWTRSMSTELVPFGITVNMISPGWIPVERHENDPQEQKNAYLAAIPAGRGGVPDDLAGVIVFLAGDSSSFITGQNICVNGGLTVA